MNRYIHIQPARERRSQGDDPEMADVYVVTDVPV